MRNLLINLLACSVTKRIDYFNILHLNLWHYKSLILVADHLVFSGKNETIVLVSGQKALRIKKYFILFPRKKLIWRVAGDDL